MAEERVEEEVDLSQHEPPRREHRPDALVEHGTVGEPDLHEPSGSHVLAHVPLQKLHDAQASHGRFVQRLQFVGGKAARYRLTDGVTLVLEYPLTRGRNGEAIVLSQFDDTRRSGMPQQVSRRRVEAARIVRQPPRDESAILQLAEANRDVGALCGEVATALLSSSSTFSW